MGNFIWRSFIIMVIFLAGLLVGNIFAPKQILEEKDITALTKPESSLDIEKQTDYIALQQSQDIKELYTAFLIETYQKTKREYEYQLENLNKNDQSKKDFLKAQKNYLTLSAFIEQNYPLNNTSEEPAPIVQEENSKEKETRPETTKQNLNKQEAQN